MAAEPVALPGDREAGWSAATGGGSYRRLRISSRCTLAYPRG